MDVIITAMPTERMDKMQENDKRQQEVQESVQEYHEDENAIDLISIFIPIDFFIFSIISVLIPKSF